MAQNSEQIESKLCAYIEGELDERGRAEIERHLLANPHHRKLLAELGETRRMVQNLPRESAPPELYEAFQGQLERAVLLDYEDGRDEPPVYRISRFPQVFAAAAIVMLAAGLGTIVYFALPTTNTNRSVAVVDKQPSPATGPLDIDTPGTDHAALLRAAAATPGKAAANANEAMTRSTSATTTPAADGAIRLADAPSLLSMAERLRGTAGGDPNAGLFVPAGQAPSGGFAEPVVVVVSADNPAPADDVLLAALGRIPNVSWTDATPSRAPAALAFQLKEGLSSAENNAGEKKLGNPVKAGQYALAGPEAATTTRMLKQATDVLQRTRVSRSERDALVLNDEEARRSYQYRKREQDAAASGLRQTPAEPETAPRPTGEVALAPASDAAAAPAAPGGPAQKPTAATTTPAEGPLAAVKSAAPAPGAAPAAPAPVVVAAQPTTTPLSIQASPATPAAKTDEWGLADGASKERFSREPSGQPDRARRAMLPGSTQPAPAEGGELFDAYRVIVAQNVPRSQVELLRRQLGVATTTLEQELVQANVDVYNARVDRLADEKADAADQKVELQKPLATKPAADGIAGRGGKSTAFDEETYTRLKQSAAAEAEPVPALAKAGATQPAESKLNASKERTVRSGDTLRIKITEYRKPAIEHEVRVAADGTLAVPAAGEPVYSDGLTVAELERHLEATIAREKSANMHRQANAPGGGAGVGGGAAAKGPATPAPAAATGGMSVAHVSIATVESPLPEATKFAAAPARQEADSTNAVAAKQQGQTRHASTGPTTATAAAPAKAEEMMADAAPVASPVVADRAADALATAADDRLNVVFVVRRSGGVAQTELGGLPPASAPVSAVAGKSIADSEILIVTIEDAAGLATPTNVRVAEDGTIDVPRVGKVRALGRTPDEVRADVDARLLSSKSTPTAPVAKAKVARPTEAATAAEPPPAPAVAPAPPAATTKQ